MDVLKPGQSVNSWEKQVVCPHCGATLKIRFSDIQVATEWKGIFPFDKLYWVFYINCGFNPCKKTIRLNNLPDFIVNKIISNPLVQARFC